MTRRVVFVHIPRTAGSSILQTSLFDQQLPGYRRLEELLRGEVQANGHFAFCFMRNPLDRLVSAFFHLMQDPALADEEIRTFAQTWLRPYGSFTAFVRDFYRHEAIMKFPHFRPQVHFARGVDLIGRFEALEEDWQRICQLGKLPVRPLAKVNTSSHRHFSTYYDRDTETIVRRVYEHDFRLWAWCHENRCRNRLVWSDDIGDLALIGGWQEPMRQANVA